LKELLTAKLEVQRQEILSHMPQPGQSAQPKSFIEQITEAIAAIGSLKEAGPMLRSILGVPESAGNPGSNAETPIEETLRYRKFLDEERRADERHKMLMGLGQTARDNLGDGVSALAAAAKEAKGTGSKQSSESTEEQPQIFSCADCKTQFSAPAEWAGQPLKCPNPQCGREYSKEDLLA